MVGLPPGGSWRATFGKICSSTNYIYVGNLPLNREIDVQDLSTSPLDSSEKILLRAKF